MLIFTFGAFGSLEPILQVFLVEQLKISTSLLVFAFILPTLAYPITVHVINSKFKKISHKALMCFGLFLGGFSMFLVGPCTLTQIEPSIYITLLALFILGSSMAFAMIPSLPDMLDDASKNLSYVDPSLLSDRLSGLVALSISLGRAFSPPLFGALEDSFNFQDVCAIFGGILFAYALIYGTFGGGFKAIAGCNSSKPNQINLITESELSESKKTVSV